MISTTSWRVILPSTRRLNRSDELFPSLGHLDNLGYAQLAIAAEDINFVASLWLFLDHHGEFSILLLHNYFF
jgi:hypothetical protein